MKGIRTASMGPLFESQNTKFNVSGFLCWIKESRQGEKGIVSVSGNSALTGFICQAYIQRLTASMTHPAVFDYMIPPSWIFPNIHISECLFPSPSHNFLLPYKKCSTSGPLSYKCRGDKAPVNAQSISLKVSSSPGYFQIRISNWDQGKQRSLKLFLLDKRKECSSFLSAKARR